MADEYHRSNNCCKASLSRWQSPFREEADVFFNVKKNVLEFGWDRLGHQALCLQMIVFRLSKAKGKGLHIDFKIFITIFDNFLKRPWVNIIDIFDESAPYFWRLLAESITILIRASDNPFI
jgi:hypothetical protein